MVEVQCRTCLGITDLESSFHLVHKHLLGKTLKEIMLLFIPEMVPSLIGDLICVKCYKTLRAFAKFIEKSIEVENTLKMIKDVLGDTFDKKNTCAEKSTTKSNFRKLPQQFAIIKGLQNLQNLPQSEINTCNQKNLKNATLKEETNVKGPEELRVQLTPSRLKHTFYLNTNSINVCEDKVQEQVRQLPKKQQGMGVIMEKRNLLEQKVCESCRKPFFQDVGMLDATKCRKCLSVEEEKSKVTMAGVSECNGTDPADSSSETASSVIEISDPEVSDFDEEEEVCYNEIVGAEGTVNVVRLNSLNTYVIGDYDRVISTPLPTNILPNILNDVSQTDVEVFQFGAASNTERKRILLFGKKKPCIRCPVCKDRFYDHKALSSHFSRTHMGDPAAKKVFDVVQRTSRNSRISQCPVCQKIVSSGRLLSRHLRLSHKDYIPYKCGKCGKGFRVKGSYVNHLTLYKNFDSCDYQKCSFCKKMFSKAEFSKHMEDHKCFTCEKCGESFAKVAYLKTHESTHQKKDDHLCFVCGKAFKFASYFYNHLKIHEAEGTKVHMCDKCPKTFSTNLRLWSHIRLVHRQKKQFECSECNQKCSTAYALRYHKRLKHSKNFSHVCDICGAQFVRGDYFRRHMKAHAVTKDPYKPSMWRKYVKNQTEPLKCKYCLKSFKGIYELRTHIIGHIKCIRYKCRYCDLSFSCATNRLRHEKRHKDPNFELSCKVCWKRMETKEELDEHLAKHDRLKKYKCKECDELFASKYLLLNHISENHISKEEVEKEKAAVLHEGLEEFLL